MQLLGRRNCECREKTLKQCGLVLLGSTSKFVDAVISSRPVCTIPSSRETTDYAMRIGDESLLCVYKFLVLSGLTFLVSLGSVVSCV